jgi:hypothetical protein
MDLNQLEEKIQGKAIKKTECLKKIKRKCSFLHLLPPFIFILILCLPCFRAAPTEAGATGFVKILDPYPYGFSWGNTEEEVTRESLAYLREVIDYEGGHTIAAIFMEAVTGTNGVLPPPKGYV